MGPPGEEDLTREDGSIVKVGDRVESEGFLATVKYIGEVPPKKGTWLGVEWDDPSRGKHDGTKDGKRYFQSAQPTAGSFVRPKKVTIGVSYMNAIADRYGKIAGDNAGVNTEELYVKGTKQCTVLEMVGAKKINQKQSQLDRLVEAVLRGMSVYGTGLNTDLRLYTPSITELDLSKNLLSSWEDVAHLASQLQRLRSLNISENKLPVPANPLSLRSAFPSLKTVVLNRMKYNWSEVLQCSSMFPSLRQLHVCFNNIRELSDPGKQLSGLELLNLEANQIGNWKEILKIACLSDLRTLILNGIGLEDMYFPDVCAPEKTRSFPKLTSISVARNKISKWRSMTELNKLQCLKELTVRINPVLNSESEGTVRELLIAKIAGLKLINRSEVLPEERKGAEIDYLKKFGKDWLENGGNRDPEKNNPSSEFLAEHPRFMELVEALGAPEDSEMKEESKILKDTLISVKICSRMDDRVLQKKLPLSMSVQKVKTLVQRLFKVPSGELKLSYTSLKMKGPEIELDNDLRQLSFYSIENNDTIQAVW